MAGSIREQQRKSKKLHFSLETPYAAVTWPEISPEDQEIFLDLLVSLITPLGLYRQEHIQPSKGKRSKSLTEDKTVENILTDVPPPPDIAKYVTVGINETTELLSAHARALLPPTFPQYLGTESSDPNPSRACPVALFVTPGPAHLTAHLPILASSSQTDHRAQPRLIRLSPSSQTRLAGALAIPRVSTIGILDCSEARRLLDLVRERVEPVSVPWLNGKDRQFTGTAIKAIAPSDEQWKKREGKRKLKAARKAKRSSHS